MLVQIVKRYNLNEHDGMVVVRMIVSWRMLWNVLESDSGISENDCGDCENGEDDSDCGDASVTPAYNACASVWYD